MHRTILQLGLVLQCGLLAGCAGVPSQTVNTLARKSSTNPERQRWDTQARSASDGTPKPGAPATGQRNPVAGAPDLNLVSASKPVDATAQRPGELTTAYVVEQVLARNPSLAQMKAAWQAASNRFPQVTSLDDPMLGGAFAPASIGSPHVDFAFRLEVSQKYPFPGKLCLRGDNAQAEADAAGNDFKDVRLQLIESARNALYDYYLVSRALTVNDEALKLLKDFQANAETRYRTGLAPQQDVLQAEVELGRQQERQLVLERIREVAIARINTLMNLPTSAPLPPAPRELKHAEGLLAVEELQARALAQQPVLAALADRIRADQAALALAHKEFAPDFEVLAAFDTFWQSPQQALQGQVGVRLNLPVRTTRRCGGVAEAEARLAQHQAELEKQKNQVSLQVEEASAQVRESDKMVRLYTDSILPSAEANVKAAQSAYVTGKTPFLSLIEAQRTLVGLRDRFYEAQTDAFRRRATLERVIGEPGAGAPAHTSGK